jgi:hypothetical protein
VNSRLDIQIALKFLSTYDWSCAHDTTSVDAGIASLNAAVQDATEQAIPRVIINSKSKVPHWYSSSLRYYIRKRIIFTDALKKKSDHLYRNFSFYRKLMKAIIKSERLKWLKYIDGNLKSQPKLFWKHVASFKKINSLSIQLEADGMHLIEPYDVADEFSMYFQSIYNNPCPVVFPTVSSSEFLPLAPVSDTDMFKAIKPLKTSKPIGVYYIPGFVIKGCTDIFLPVLKRVFNVSLAQQ